MRVLTAPFRWVGRKVLLVGRMVSGRGVRR
jgi:hypothetical protein